MGALKGSNKQCALQLGTIKKQEEKKKICKSEFVEIIVLENVFKKTENEI